MAMSQNRNRNRKDPSDFLVHLFFIALLFFNAVLVSVNGDSFGSAVTADNENEQEEKDTVESCGGFGSGWTRYKDNKCLKVMGVGTQSEGQLACYNEQRTLTESILHVRSPEEQDFLAKMIWMDNGEKYDNVSFWLARRHRVNRIVREHPEEAHFQGQSPGHVPGLTMNEPEICVHMEPPLGDRKETTCQQQGLAICQKPQKWTYQRWGSLTRSMKDLIQMAKGMKEAVDEMEKKLGPLWNEFERRTKRSIVLSSRCVKRVSELREQMTDISNAMKRAQRDLDIVQKALDYLKTKFDGFKDVVGAFRVELAEAKGVINGDNLPSSSSTSTTSEASKADDETTEASADEEDTTEAPEQEETTEPFSFSMNIDMSNAATIQDAFKKGEKIEKDRKEKAKKGKKKDKKKKGKKKGKKKDKKKDKKKKEKEIVTEAPKPTEKPSTGGSSGGCGILGLGCMFNLFGKK